MDIDYLIDRLEALIHTGKRVPLSNKVMVDEQECYALIDQMRAVVPEEVKAAKRTLNDRERILDEADDTARQILEQAEQERRMMIEQEGLLVEAERQRDVLLGEATQEAFQMRNHAQTLYDEAVSQTQEMREGANQYATQVLQELEGLLDKHLTVVRNGLQNFIQQSQQYQQQMEDYQHQYRPQYAPSKTELATTPPKSANNGASQPAARPRPAASVSQERPVERKVVNAPSPARPVEAPPPVTRPAASANQTNNRPPTPSAPPIRSTAPTPMPTGADKRPTGRLNVVEPSPLRPVPKINSRPTNDDGDEVPDEPDNSRDFDFDEPPAPRRPNPPNNPSIRRDPSPGPSNRPTRPPF